MDRVVKQVIPAMDTADGDGVKLRRSIGMQPGLRVDPFLMLDEISADQSADYMGGFPAHPHRGFETVTYMLEGLMEHRDHLGNIGLLKPNGAQWMTAARGIIHEEMPKQDAGRMHGFQLWLNLPAAEKMKAANYRDIEPEQIAEKSFNGGKLRLVAGKLKVVDEVVQGPINGPDYAVSTDPIMADIQLDAGASLSLNLPAEHNAFLYVFEGGLVVDEQLVAAPSAAVLSHGNRLAMASSGGGRALLLAGKPIGEPIAQRGPFVMNTQEELYQAMKDYGNGTLVD